jgi:predicted  nucleic acid-binding Zn-ribbon protein
VSIFDTVKAHGRHRKLTRLELAEKASRLEREADEATCQLVALTTQVDGLKAERNRLQDQLDEAGIELSGAREDHADTVARTDARHAEIVAEMQQQIDDLTRRLNVGVLAGAAASETQEIDARELQDRFADGSVVSLHHSPQADVPAT